MLLLRRLCWAVLFVLFTSVLCSRRSGLPPLLLLLPTTTTTKMLFRSGLGHAPATTAVYWRSEVRALWVWKGSQWLATLCDVAWHARLIEAGAERRPRLPGNRDAPARLTTTCKFLCAKTRLQGHFCQSSFVGPFIITWHHWPASGARTCITANWPACRGLVVIFAVSFVKLMQ